MKVTSMAERERAEHVVADLGALSDLCTPWCLHVVATLRIADHIEAGITEIGRLALAAGCDAEALHSVLGHLVGKGTPNPEFDITGGWEPVRTVVDVGGGTGAMLAEMLRARPHLQGILVDLPKAVARSAETFAAAGVSDRVTAVGQSFFDPLPA